MEKYMIIALGVFVALELIVNHLQTKRLEVIAQIVKEEYNKVIEAAGIVDKERELLKQATKILAEAIEIQKKQVDKTEHLLNGQKLKFFALNKKLKEIDSLVKEVKEFESDLNTRNKKRRRN